MSQSVISSLPEVEQILRLQRNDTTRIRIRVLVRIRQLQLVSAFSIFENKCEIVKAERRATRTGARPRRGERRYPTCRRKPPQGMVSSGALCSVILYSNLAFSATNQVTLEFSTPHATAPDGRDCIHSSTFARRRGRGAEGGARPGRRHPRGPRHRPVSPQPLIRHYSSWETLGGSIDDKYEYENGSG